MKWLFALLLFFSTASVAGPVELHAHLFMKEGMTWAFRGDFFGPLEATSYRDLFSSQANPQALEESGLSIVVATLYAHPLFSLNLRDSIRRQVALARKFVSTHPDWVLATTPSQAKQALASQKHVMILALEGASGILETEEDLQEFVDGDGIRIVNLVHLMDDEYGGVAFLKGFRALSSPWAWLKQLFSPEYVQGVRTNHEGLTEAGRKMAHSLIAHHVWLDLSHASDKSAEELSRMMKDARQPLLYSHTSLRSYHEAERGISDQELDDVAKTRGIVGLMPTEQMLDESRRAPHCPSGISALAAEYRQLASKIGVNSVMIGSDYNGGVPHLAPTGPGCITGTTIDAQGLWNIGQSSEVWKAMAKLGAPVPQNLDDVSNHFIEVWTKAFGEPPGRMY